jgi:hypothetical protein
MKQKYLAVLGLLGLAGAALAVPFDNTSGGAQTATVGLGGDYVNLHAAAVAFRGVSGGINRPWTLSITTNTTEIDDSGFVNSFGAGGKLTIKPAIGVSPTITFTTTTAPAATAWFGHLILGGPEFTSITLANTIPSNGNYEIDGSNAVSGTTRDLTITANIASAANNLIRVVGDADGVVVKNTNLIFKDTAGSCAPIGLAGGNLSGNIAPDNFTVTNCLLQCDGASGNSFSFQTTTAGVGSMAAGTAIQGVNITNNDLVYKQRGTFLNGVGNATITGNKFTQIGTTAGNGHSGYFSFTSNGASGWTQTVSKNVFETTASTQTSLFVYPVYVETGDTSGTINVNNNTIRVSSLTVAANQDPGYAAMSLGSVSTTYNVEHNSVDLIGSANISTTTTRNVGAVRVPTALNTGAALNLKNNILKSAQTGTSASLINLASAANVVSVGNDLVGSTNTGIVGNTLYPNLAAWQAAGFDSAASGGQSADPAAATPPWNSALHFPTAPTGIGKVASSTVLTDIDGDARPATNAYPGADQPPPLAGIAEWSLM